MKYVKVSDNSYKLSVTDGGTIYLYTGAETGEVRISGDLIVQGNTTTVQSEELTVKDNIIILNQGETGAGITLDEAGIRIDRGTLQDAYIVLDEDITNSRTGLPGVFAFKFNDGSAAAIRTNAINTAGSDLHLINSGTGVITVTGTTDYENQVTDDDDITNKKYVDDAISTSFATVFLKQIGDGVSSPSSIRIFDSEPSPDGSGVDHSKITFTIDGVIHAEMYDDRLEYGNLRFTDTIIETISSNDDLVLRAPGTGAVRIDDTLHINSTPGDDDVAIEPTQPIDGSKIYISTQSTGKSGIYFVNDEANRDELVSKNRALLFGMLF